LTYNKAKAVHTVDWGMTVIVGKIFAEELSRFPDCGELVKKIYAPVKFISAGNSGVADSKKYFDNANNPKSLVVIKGADHNFNNPESEQKLFEETYDWVKKY